MADRYVSDLEMSATTDIEYLVALWRVKPPEEMAHYLLGHFMLMPKASVWVAGSDLAEIMLLCQTKEDIQ